MTTLQRLVLSATCAIAATGCGDSPTPTAATPPAATTFTFASTFTTQGSASRSFEQLATGSVSVTLRSVSPDIRIGVGLGIPRADGTGCNLAHAVEVTAGSAPQITTTADPGVWCVRVWDVGLVPEHATFALDVQHN